MDETTIRIVARHVVMTRDGTMENDTAGEDAAVAANAETTAGSKREGDD